MIAKKFSSRLISGTIAFTFLLSLFALPSMGSVAFANGTDPVINEFVFNHTGTDTHEFVEIYGMADTTYDTLTIVEIEGDSSGAGVIDDGIFDIGTTDASGYWTTGFQYNLFENGTVTLLLVENFIGQTGDDLDPNKDGILDVTPWDRIVDDIAVYDGGSSDHTYASTVLAGGFDGSSYAPGGASRLPNGTDTDSVDDWMRNDWDGAGLPGFFGSPSYGEAYNTPGVENAAVPESDEVCGDDYTPIYDIQGDGSDSPIEDEVVSTEGAVTGVFQGYDQLRGFFIQDPEGDGSPATSDGIFVYYRDQEVSVGDAVRVRGTVKEYYGMTEITYVSDLVPCGVGVDINPTPVNLPVADLDNWEALESMLQIYPYTLYATEVYNLGRYGQVSLSIDGRLFNPTDIVPPGDPANAQQDLNDRSRVLLDDGSNAQNPDIVPYLGEDNTLRLADTVQNLTVVMDYAYGDYRLHPTIYPEFVRSNPRTSAPDQVGGVIRVATFNVWNYWTTLDERGADTPEEFERQKAKLVPAILGLGADVIGLQELENNGPVAVGDLVDALNEEVGSDVWAFVPDPDYPGGLESTNAIKSGIIYRADRVTPVGDPVADLAEIHSDARPPIAQTFNARGEIFTVVSNHFKSKGCSDAEGLDEDQGDGQSCYNYKRTMQAEALLDFVDFLKVSSGDPDVVIVGDYNSYAMEDPIVTLEDGGLTNQNDNITPADRYSYVYFGQSGQLDFIFNTSSLDARVTGVDAWHINPDEPKVLDYNMEYNPPYMYQPDQYRSSDHDPVVVGFCDAVPPELKVFVFPSKFIIPNRALRVVWAHVRVSDNFDPNPVVSPVTIESNEPEAGGFPGDIPFDIVILRENIFLLRAEFSPFGTGRVYTITYKATDSCGNATVVNKTVTVPFPGMDMPGEAASPMWITGGVEIYLPFVKR